MFKAVNNLREQKGFTLIELLIVIAIIGILAAIAIPAFLGQREKARQRSVEASARGSLSEVTAAIDDFGAGIAMVFLTNPETMECFEPTDVLTKNSCANLYSDLDSNQYTTLASVMNLIKTHHNTGKEEVSPYDGSLLVMYDGDGTCNADTTSFFGHVVICNTNDRQGKILALSDEGAIIYNSIVSAR